MITGTESITLDYLAYYKINDDKLYFIDLRYKNGRKIGKSIKEYSFMSDLVEKNDR